MATHSSILAWRVPWTVELGGLYSPWDLPNSGMEARSPALQADSLLSEPLGKPGKDMEGQL